MAVDYNTKRPHRGYKSMGKRPVETVTMYFTIEQQQDMEVSHTCLQYG